MGVLLKTYYVYYITFLINDNPNSFSICSLLLQNSGEIDFTEFVAFMGEMKDMSSNPRKEAALNHGDDDDDEHTDWT